MDFDEYEYLEKTVENPEVVMDDPSTTSNGAASEEKEKVNEMEGERKKTSSRCRRDDPEHDGDERHSKHLKIEDDGQQQGNRDRGSSGHRSHVDRDGERVDKARKRSSREERNVKDREKDRERAKEKEKLRKQEREMNRELERERDRSRTSRSRPERYRDDERDRRRDVRLDDFFEFLIYFLLVMCVVILINVSYVILHLYTTSKV